jgi:hypothetical protein
VNWRSGTAALLLAVFGLGGAWKLFALMAGVAVVWWLMRLQFHPRGPCWACRGRRGRNWGSDETQWGWCRVCGGSGERLRLGARMVNPGLRRR